MLSELERDVLEAVMLGRIKVGDIANFCGIPEFTVEELLKRLIDRGYLTYDLKPTERAYKELKWVGKGTSYSRDLKKFIIKVLNVVVIFLLLYLIMVVLL